MGSSLLNCIRLFGVKGGLLGRLRSPEILIPRSAYIGAGVLCRPTGLITLGEGVRLFGRSIIVADPGVEAILKIGDGTKVNFGLYVNYSGGCTIGTGTAVGPGVTILTSTLDRQGAGTFAQRGNVQAEVRIGNNCWVGAGAILLPGVIIPSGTTIAAGAVVTGRLGESGVWAGVPARRIQA